MSAGILRTASAGSLESSDCLVTVTPTNAAGMEYNGANRGLFLARTEKLVRKILEEHSVKNAKVTVQDQGALEVTLRARVETAIERAMEANPS